MEGAAEKEITKSIEGAFVEVGRDSIRSRVPQTEVRSMSLTSRKRTIVLNNNLVGLAHTKYNLIIPRGGSKAVNAQAAKLDSAFMRLIAAFANTASKSGDDRRVLL